MAFKWFNKTKHSGRISVDFASIYTYTVWAILSVGVFLSLCAYAIIVLQTAQVPESGKVAIFLCIVFTFFQKAKTQEDVFLIALKLLEFSILSLLLVFLSSFQCC